MILRDAVHGLVAFESEEDAIVPRLLGTREVQRLRRIRQLGLTSLAYPGAEHSRFSHALGAAHVMKLLLARLRQIDGDLPFWQRVTSERARDAVAAALLHDVGHGPLSHLFESAMPGAVEHEEWTVRILLDPSSEVHRTLVADDPGLPRRVADLIQGKHELPYLARAVSGTFDVDRCDYLLRDAHATGVNYGSFDLDWLLRSLCFGVPATPDAAPPLAIDGAKGIPAIESFLLARLFMFQQVYFHKTERASEWMLAKILERVGRLAQEGTRLSATPRAISDIARTGECSLKDYLALDDATLWVALTAWCEAADPVLSDLCQRFAARRLFKTYELFGEQATPRARLLAHDALKALASEAGLDPEVYVGLDAASTVAFDDSAEPLSVVFPNGVSRALSDVSFLLGRLRGERMERVRLLFAPELRERVASSFGPESVP